MLLKALEEVGDRAERDDGRRDGDHPPHPRRRPADPEELVRRLAETPARPRAGARRCRAAPAAAAARGRAAPPRRRRRRGAGARAPRRRRAPLARYARFEDVVALVRARRDMSLLVEIETGVRLARYAPGRIEFEPADGAAPDLAARLAQRLQALDRGALGRLGGRQRRGADHRRGARRAARATCTAQARAHPLVQAVLAAFPGAEIKRGAAARRACEAGRRRRRRTTTTGIRSTPSQRRADGC